MISVKWKLSDIIYFSLSGYGRTSKKWKSGSMRFKLNSKKINDRSSSAFAVQIEMSKENGPLFFLFKEFEVVFQTMHP